MPKSKSNNGMKPEGLWSQLDNASKHPYTPVSGNDIGKAMKEMADKWELDSKIKNLKFEVEARFTDKQLERVNQLLDSRDPQNIELVENLVETTKPYKAVERGRFPLHIYTGTKGAELINKAIQDEAKRSID